MHNAQCNENNERIDLKWTDKMIFPKTYNPAFSRYFPILYLKKLLLLPLLRMRESSKGPLPLPPQKKNKQTNKQTNEAISVYDSYSSIIKIVQQKNTICSL